MPRRILIVDDEPLKRITLRIELSELGYDVTEAPDAHSAVRILDGKPIDLVVSDVRMPGPSGLDLLTHVKRLREKLGGAGDYIETVRGVGYRFADNPAEATG